MVVFSSLIFLNLLGSCLFPKIKSLLGILSFSCSEEKEFKTLHESIEENIILPPEIKIKAIGTSEEEREIVTHYKTALISVPDEKILGRFDYIPAKKEAECFYSNWKRKKEGISYFPSEYKELKYGLVGTRTESRIVDNWTKDMIFEYNSWQDNSMINIEKLKSFCSILYVTYEFEVVYDNEASEIINEIKNDLKTEGLEKADEVRTKEEFFCPKMVQNETCYADEIERARAKVKWINKNILFSIIFIIFFLTGYSSILEICFMVYTAEVTIKFTKYVSGQENKYRCGYMEEDEISKQNLLIPEEITYIIEDDNSNIDNNTQKKEKQKTESNKKINIIETIDNDKEELKQSLIPKQNYNNKEKNKKKSKGHKRSNSNEIKKIISKKKEIKKEEELFEDELLYLEKEIEKELSENDELKDLKATDEK